MIVTDHTREGEEQASFLRLIDQVSDYHEFKEDMHEQLEIPSNLQVIFKLKMSLNNTGGVSMLKISGEKDWAATLPVLRSSVGANLEVHCKCITCSPCCMTQSSRSFSCNICLVNQHLEWLPKRTNLYWSKT